MKGELVCNGGGGGWVVFDTSCSPCNRPVMMEVFEMCGRGVGTTF